MTVHILGHYLSGALGWIDVLVISSAVIPLFVISYVFGREEKDTGDFFLGGRKVPSVVACLSFVATEVSALTIVGVQVLVYRLGRPAQGSTELFRSKYMRQADRQSRTFMRSYISARLAPRPLARVSVLHGHRTIGLTP